MNANFTSSQPELLINSPSDPALESMIKVENVTMIFNIASERLNTLKEYAIALSRKELRFKEFRALDGISIDVKKGDVFGILGTNGSGKSTLLKIIAGVLEPSKGTCTVNGNIAPLIELGAGFDLELTARENIYLNGALLGYSKKFIDESFEEIVDFADVREFLDMPMKNYSSGMVARIAFAIATVIVPDILIVDEVLSVGDFMFQQKCEQRIQSLIKEHGVTVLIVSHNNDQIERLCNKAAWIEKGHMRAIGDAKDVTRIYRAIGGRKGSLESERRVLSAVAQNEPIPQDYLQRICADDRYGTANKLNFIDSPSSRTVIIASDAGERESRIAVGLASMLDAHFFTSKSDVLPDIITVALEKVNPETIIVLGGTDSISTTAFETYKSNGVSVIRLEETPNGLEAYRYAEKSGGQWGDTAVLAAGQSEHALLFLAPFLYSEKAPIFYIDADNGADAQELQAILKNFRRVILTIPESSLDCCLKETIENGNFEVISFVESDLQKVNHKINAWLADELSVKRDNHRVLVTAPSNEVDNRPAGIFAGRTGAFVDLIDPFDLDRFATALDYFKANPSPDCLFFLGGEACFSTMHREAIGRAALSE